MPLLSQARHLLLILVVVVLFVVIELFMNTSTLDGRFEGVGSDVRTTGPTDCSFVDNHLPQLIVTGTMKSGSGALMELLQGYSAKRLDSSSWLNIWSWMNSQDSRGLGKHRFVAGSGVKPRYDPSGVGGSAALEGTREVHYFGLSYESYVRSNGTQCGSKSPEKHAYAAHFTDSVTATVHHSDTSSRQVVFFDKSPAYMRSARTLAQIAELVPGAKHVLLLRDAVGRLYSEFQHHCRHRRYVLVPASDERSHVRSRQGATTSDLPLIHGEILGYLSRRLDWNGSSWHELRPDEWFHKSDMLRYPGSPELFHAYITHSPVTHKGTPHFVRKILSYRDVEELALRLYFSSKAESFTPRLQANTVKARREDILRQWQQLMSGKRSLYSLFTFPQGQNSNALQFRDRASAHIRQWVLLTGPESDLAHSMYSEQMEEVFASLTRDSTAFGPLRSRLLIIDQADMYRRTLDGVRGSGTVVRDVERLLAGESGPKLSPEEVTKRYSLLSESPTGSSRSRTGPSSGDKYPAMLPESHRWLHNYFAPDHNRTMVLLQQYHRKPGRTLL